jgi:hypothetical protein
MCQNNTAVIAVVAVTAILANNTFLSSESHLGLFGIHVTRRHFLGVSLFVVGELFGILPIFIELRGKG